MIRINLTWGGLKQPNGSSPTSSLLTARLIWYTPSPGYVCVLIGVLVVSIVPSPQTHSYVVIVVPAIVVEGVASKDTVVLPGFKDVVEHKSKVFSSTKFATGGVQGT